MLVVGSQASGGIWHYAQSLSRALAAAGLDVALGTPSPFEPLAQGDGVPIHIMGTRSQRATWPPRAIVQRLIDHVGKLIGLLRIVRELRPHIVHLNGSLGKFDFLYMRILRAMAAKVVYTAHDPHPLGRRVTWFDRAKYRQAAAVLVHSQNSVEDLIACGVERAKIAQIPHGNYLHFCDDLGLSQPEARRLLGLPEFVPVVLFFGAISPYKGLDLLLEAFSVLARTDPGVSLMIAGDPRMDLTEYVRLIDRLALGDRIRTDLRYIPFEEFAKFFVACDVVVLPYRRIYQSGILQLAYGFGRPVVVTNIGGIADTVRKDQTGIVAAAENADALAAAIRKILTDPEGARKMGGHARHLARTKYSWNAVARVVMGVYESVRAGNRTPSADLDFGGRL